MATHALLLRGINVGKARQLPMAELRELMTDLGYGEVRTYLRTGNIVLSTSHGRTRLVSSVEEGIKGRFGMPVPVVVRSRANSTLTPAFWKKLGADDKATVRNWNTVLMLQRMLES
jgi:uncharacterized protein (DUF1697 family)